MYLLLLGLQLFHVLFLLLHDWIPLGRLNDLRALREHVPAEERLRNSLLTALPFAVAFGVTAFYRHGPMPAWAMIYNLICFVLLAISEWQMWWSPYFYGTTQERVIRYKKLFGSTHSFLPRQNGIRPNTLLTIFHLSTFATLFVLLLASRSGSLL